MHGRRLIPVLAAISVAIVVVAIASTGGDPAAGPVEVRIAGAMVGPAIPPGFVGFSFEYSAVPAYAGTDPRALNPVLVRLIRNLNPGQVPQLRIGGDSADRTWWPVPRMKRPGGVRYDLTPRWAAVTAALARTLRARLLLGINMEAGNSRLAAYEARQLVRRIGRRSIRALELGNEPELYAAFPWYQRHGRGVNGRKRPYGPREYAREFTRVAALLPPIGLAGPATGAPEWEAVLRQFLRAEPHLSLLTMHRYATRGCFVSPGSPSYHTIANLLTPLATRGLADGLAPYAHLGVPARLDELNSVNCGGARGVSDRFASALWALDALFELARAGFSGVNFHTFPGARYAPFTFQRTGRRWRASVTPVYYGMLMFTQAAPPGSRFLSGSGQIHDGLYEWALRAPDRTTRVVLINVRVGKARKVMLRLAGASAPATVRRLSAPSLDAGAGVTIGGRSFGLQTATGTLVGARRSATVLPDEGRYQVSVPGASAALLTIGG